MNKGPFWIPPTLYGGCDQTKGPPPGVDPPMEAMPSGALYIFFLSPFFLGITNVLGRSGTGIFQEGGLFAPYKKVMDFVPLTRTGCLQLITAPDLTRPRD